MNRFSLGFIFVVTYLFGIAITAPPAAASDAGAPFKLLSYQNTITVQPNGDYVRTVHKVIEPLTKLGVQHFGQVRTEVTTDMERYKLISAKTIAPDGKVYAVKKSDIHTQPDHLLWLGFTEDCNINWRTR
jgi:hypothetical protein